MQTRRRLNSLIILTLLTGLLSIPSPVQAAEYEWTWMSGTSTVNQYGIYGTQGIPDAANVPGARDTGITWTDAAGDLWLFGGLGYAASGNTGYLNDLWRYNVATGQWTWMNGASTVNQRGVYGTHGVSDAANVPGARYASIAWTDAAGDLWLFGGFGYAASGTGPLNDLWRYSTTTGQWTWMSGASDIDQYGVYGIQGAPDAANVPGARYRSISWTDGAGDLWLFGGLGYATSGGIDDLNDLWRFDLPAPTAVTLTSFDAKWNGADAGSALWGVASVLLAAIAVATLARRCRRA